MGEKRDASPPRPLSIFGASRMTAAPYLHRDRLHESQVRRTKEVVRSPAAGGTWERSWQAQRIQASLMGVWSPTG
jgi:hypothetical protein